MSQVLPSQHQARSRSVLWRDVFVFDMASCDLSNNRLVVPDGGGLSLVKSENILLSLSDRYFSDIFSNFLLKFAALESFSQNLQLN